LAISQFSFSRVDGVVDNSEARGLLWPRKMGSASGGIITSKSGNAEVAFSVSDRANGTWGVPRLRAIFWHFLISIYRPRAMWQVPRSEATNCRATPEGIASIVI
jgi:hypothetical protein